MSKSIADLQKLIAERAEKKLDGEINTLSASIMSQPLLRSSHNMPELAYQGLASDGTDVWKSSSVLDLFSQYSKGRYLNKLKAYWLPIYIEREAKEFIEKVDSLQQDVENLLSNQPY